jgi:hypothetical protein
LQARVNLTNPTPYSANIPYINIHIVKNGSIIGEATADHIDVKPGNNTNLLIKATWDPSMGNEDAPRVGRELISQYLSGYNISVGLKTHRGSIPAAPQLGEALSGLNITVAAPRLSLPDTGDDRPGEKEHFIRDAIFHVFSSTATFTLVSPLRDETLYIDWVNATAIYNHTEPIGQIEYGEPIEVPPGASLTPRMPVDWSVGSVGYEAVKKALGGHLKLDATADVALRLGAFKETVWYVGRGIGAGVKF